MIGVDIKLIKVFKAADANFKFHTSVLVWCPQRLLLSETYINVAFRFYSNTHRNNWR